MRDMTTYTIEQTAKEIKSRLKNVSGSSYFTFEFNGEYIKIRVSDHSANHNNNSNDNKVMSFCTNYNKQQSNMVNEWICDNAGYCEDYYKDVEEILDWELN